MPSVRSARCTAVLLGTFALSGWATTLQPRLFQWPTTAHAEQVAYICPMHADAVSETPGRCARCGMALVPASASDTREPLVLVDTVPHASRAGQPVRLTLRVSDPDTGDLVRRFEIVHEKPYHLFLVSRDLTFFRHLHPEQSPDGTWETGVVLPTPGAYAVISDFTPTGGAGQLRLQTIVTADYRDEVLSARPVPVSGDTHTQTVDGLSSTLSVDPPVPRSGSYAHLRFHLTRDGAPAGDLEPYLGARGHLLLVRDDLAEYAHAHPPEVPSVPPATWPAAGPDVEFDVLMPSAGRYRAWAQFQSRGAVGTFDYTFDVID